MFDYKRNISDSLYIKIKCDFYDLKQRNNLKKLLQRDKAALMIWVWSPLNLWVRFA